MKKFWIKLNRMFTAMSYAEAGNFDEVRQILNESSDSTMQTKVAKVKTPPSAMPITGIADNR